MPVLQLEKAKIATDGIQRLPGLGGLNRFLIAIHKATGLRPALELPPLLRVLRGHAFGYQS